MNGLDLVEQELQRSIWRNSYWAFFQAAWPYLSPDELQPNWHHELLCGKMQKVAEGDIRRMIINCGTGTLKSSIIVEAFPAWVWTRNKAPLSGPQVRFLCMSHAPKLMDQHSLVCRELIESDWYQEWFGDRFKLTQKSIEHLRNNHLGHRRVSLATSLTGLDADICLFDDPHELMDGQDSDIKRERVIQAFNGSVERRVRNPNANAIVIGGARTHPYDLPGTKMDNREMLEREGYEVVCLPDLYDPKHPFVCPEDPRKEKDEPLQPERESKEQILVRADREGDFTFSGQSQQWPTAKAGSLFAEAVWPTVAVYPKDNMVTIRSWDFARTDPTKRKPGSRGVVHYTVGLLYGYHLTDRQHYVLDVIRVQKDEEEVLDLVEAVAKEDGGQTHILIEEEKGAAGGHAVHAYRKLVLPGYEVVGWPASNPIVDARPVIQEARRGGIWLLEGDWNQAFKREAVDFPMGTFDDQIVALSHAHGYLASIIRAKKLKGAQPHPAQIAARQQGERLQ